MASVSRLVLNASSAAQQARAGRATTVRAAATKNDTPSYTRRDLLTAVSLAAGILGSSSVAQAANEPSAAEKRKAEMERRKAILRESRAKAEAGLTSGAEEKAAKQAAADAEVEAKNEARRKAAEKARLEAEAEYAKAAAAAVKEVPRL